MVRKAKNWPWSGYRATIGAADLKRGLNVDWILSQFAKREARGNGESINNLF